MIRVHAIIKGKVQGVWYRGSTTDMAVALGLAGWVRNLPDGSVEAVFEGEREAVEQAIGWCRTGPPDARVVGVQTSEETVEGLVPPFEIRYR